MLAELLAPLKIRGFGLEDHAVPMEFSLAENVDAVVRAVADALGVPVSASHLERTKFYDGGCGEVTH